MADPIYPDERAVRALVATPDSIVWRRSSDVRGFAGAGYALLMQVSHPTVGAGVREHSNFAAEPWKRLFRTLDFLNLLIYGGERDAAAAARGTREIHKRIKGVAPDGRRYHALEPEAYAWVHATLAESIIAVNQRFVGPMSRREVEDFYLGFRALGRLLGVRERDLPETWPAFQEYYERMIHERLEHNDVVEEVFASLERPAAPPMPGMVDPVWRVARWPAARAVRLSTVGFLHPVLRERFGLRWTRADEHALRAIAAASRSVNPVVPQRLRVFGPQYLRWRRDEIDPYLRGAPQSTGAAVAAA